MNIVHKSGKVIKIDDADAHFLRGWKVYPVRGKNVYYALRCRWNRKTKKVEKNMLHRVLMKPKNGLMVCHLNGDGLDCRRSNMSLGTHSNNGNSVRKKNDGASSKYRGVSINNGRGKRWTVMFWDSGTLIYLGRYNDEKEAARVYDKEAKRRFGKFAHLNFPAPSPSF